VNDLVKAVRLAQVRNKGKKSCAKRDLKRPEFRKTMRILERDGTGIDMTMKAPTMMKTQFHLIGRTDDVTNMETKHLRSHNKFRDFALQTKVSWSKNVLEERGCPDQIMLGCADPDFCILLALACWIETRLTENHGDAKFLFGHHNDEHEPDRINGWYGRTLKNAWKDPEFQEIFRSYGGSIGTHSLRKFPATWATENGCNQSQVETRGRWKGKKNGHVVNVYISVQQLPTDAKVASILCVGGPIKYQLKSDAGIGMEFLGEHVVPNIADLFADDPSNHIALILGSALLWASHTPGLETMMSQHVLQRIRSAYKDVRPEAHDDDYNPVAKIPLTVYRIENTLQIDEVNEEAMADTRESNGEQLARAQAMNANHEILNALLLQSHRHQQQLAINQQTICQELNQLRGFIGTQFGVANRNINRINRFAVIAGPPTVAAAAAASVAMDNNTAGNSNSTRASTGGRPAELSRKPRDLYDLWKEYTHGLDGNKPANDFSPRERGGKNKDKYCRRKNVWDCIDKLCAKGYSDRTAIDRIYQTYGRSLTVTQIINKFKEDKRHGGHINLR